jgi:hypothetical protein
MASEWTNEELQEVVQEILRRSSVDPEFRALALRDSAGAFSKVSSKRPPSDFSFKFVDNSGATKILPLPDPVSEINQEVLSDAELEAVAGGVLANTTSVATGWAS